MPVTLDVSKVGTFTKLADKTTIPGGLPPLLNEREDLHGPLEEELDLTYGFEGYKDEGCGDRFNSFFDYIKKTSKNGFSMKKVIGADFVSNRKNLQILARSPYIRKDFEIQAIRKKGVIFLCDKNSEKEQTELPLPYGYKFEQYMTLDKEGRTQTKYDKVTNAEATKAVFRTTVFSGNDYLKVFYAAEIDAMDSKNNFVELKTTALRTRKWLEYRSLNDYLQCYLGGVPYIILGKKISIDEPTVFRTDKIWIPKIPKMEVSWKQDVCFDALFKILQKIKEKLEHDEEALVVHITKEGVCFEPEMSQNCTFVDPDFLAHFE